MTTVDGGTPTGCVEFFDATTNQNLGSGSVLANGNSYQAVLNDVLLSAGSHNIIAMYSGDGTYAFSSDSFTQMVNEAPAKISISGASVTYDGNAHAANGTATGVESPNPANLTSLLNLYYSSDGGQTYSSSAPVNAGDYEIYYTFNTSDSNTNYQEVTSYTDSGVAVDIFQAPLTLTANNQTMTYGGTVPALTYTYSGLVNGDSSASFTGSLTTTVTSSSNVGSYAITEGMLAATGSYTIGTFNQGALTVNPASISYSIGNDTQAYGYPANLAADLPSSFNTDINGQTLDIAYSSTGDTSTAKAGSYAITGVVSNGTGLASNYSVTLTPGMLTVLGSGVTVIGSTLWIVGGTTTNDNVQINPEGASNTGSTGIKVDANLNHVHTTTTYTQSFTGLNIFLYGGNDNILVAPTLTINTTVNAGNGNDNVQLDAGNSTVTLGNGNDNVTAGNGNDNVRVGNGNDNVQLGNGNNTVTLGNGNANVQVGNGNNVVVAGNGNNNIQAGNGDNLIAGGLGHDNIQAGNGNNILIDGSVNLPIDTLLQVLGDWIDYGNTKSGADLSYIDSVLLGSVTFNNHNANTLHAGSGLDWFWATYAKDKLNNKISDMLN